MEQNIYDFLKNNFPTYSTTSDENIPLIGGLCDEDMIDTHHCVGFYTSSSNYTTDKPSYKLTIKITPRRILSLILIGSGIVVFMIYAPPTIPGI